MKRCSLFLAALAILALPALAADTIKWCKSLEDAQKEAKDRGALILICMTVNGEPANEAQMGVYNDPALVKATRDFVCVFANPHTDGGEIEMDVDGQKVKCSRIAPGITIRDHLKAWNDVQKSYADLNTGADGNVRIPFQFVIDGDGKVVATIANGTKDGGFDVVAADQFVAALNTLVGKFGKPLTAEDLAACQKALEAAGKAMEEGNLKEALKQTVIVIARNPRSRLADEARKIQERASAGGEEALKAAEGLVASDPVGALLGYEQVAEDYAGTPLGEKARAALAELKKRPEVKKSLAEVAARKEAEKNLAKAEEEFTAKRYSSGLKILDDVAKKYAGTPLGDKAKARAEEIRADEAIAKEVREQEAAKNCKGWLSMAKSYVKNGMIDKAKELWQKIIDQYPGTSFAAEAEAELGKVR